ncbi:hypothetical protein JOF56_007859 [Kibdelosporangium banguiense]|uniref:PE domain-containing protein n=1 Tax=Kibdelosporangium banguiense TaxID=1365924 RepID=A0ABS4TU22_9PSEU|nr:hypothetical protein [Kibdelosporangium banguiense]MBP2327474.1 hypothetical protein [Kibdelosporangium banguiense]
MEQAIRWFLEPVLNQLEKINGNYSAAHGEIKAAHDNQTPGWFGGVGNNEIPMISSSFLNAAEWQVRQLTADHAEQLRSLQDYRAMLKGHIAAIRDTEQQIATRFRAIDAELEGQGH